MKMMVGWVGGSRSMRMHTSVETSLGIRGWLLHEHERCAESEMRDGW